jgi:hypothetical protein
MKIEPGFNPRSRITLVTSPEGAPAVWTFREGETPRRPTTLGRHDAEAMVLGVSPVFCSSVLGAHREAAKPRGEEA